MVDGWNSGRYWCWGPGQNAAAREIVNWGRRTYLKRFLSKAANCLSATRFNEVRL